MGQFSEENLFGMTIRESANDGSDFTNPDADYRRLFLGEDGQLHVKDSAGAVTDIGGGSGAVATDTIWDAAGDLAQGTGANTAAKLGAGTAGYFLKAGGAATALAWAARELDYVEFTGNVTVSATAEGSTTAVVTSSSVSYDGSTAVLVEFFAPYVEVAVQDNVIIVLYDNTAGASIGKMAQITNGDAANVMRTSVYTARRLTPANGSRVYKITAFRVTANGVIGANAGGSGNLMPGFIRITRAV